MTKTKRQLRAEAVERLKQLPPMKMTGNQFVNAIVGPTALMTEQDINRALIDLLTDEELPDGDVAALLRKAARCTSVNTSVGDVLRYNVPGNGCSAWQTDEDACEALADMIERDYVPRKRWSEAVRAMKAAQDRMEQARDERDELQSRVDYLESRHCEWSDPNDLGDGCMLRHDDLVDKLRAERDEWKAKAERLDAKGTADETCPDAMGQASDELTCKMEAYTDVEFVVTQAPEVKDFTECANVCECSNCGNSFIVPSWWDSVIPQSAGWEPWPKWTCCPSCRALIVDDLGQNADMSEKGGDYVRNDGFASENVVSDPDGGSNVAYIAQDSREKLEADVRWEMSHYFAWDEKREEFIDKTMSWLDRQAAITERECLERATSERVGFDCAECAEGLGKELDARCDPLKARIAELEAERGYWHGQFMGCLTVAIRQENGPNLDKLMTYSPPEADGECWPTAETHVFTEGKASDVCASFLFEGKDKAKRKTVSGMRCWELSHVKAECPHCYHDEVMDIDEFSDDELWYGMPFGVMCSSCGRRFTVEVDDDDR